MQGSVDVRARTRSGIEALRAGDPQRARAVFEAIVRDGQADSQVWLGMALAAKGLGDAEGLRAAVDQALSLEPRNVRALLMKADHLAAVGDDRGASAFYAGALQAAPAREQLTAELHEDLRRAQSAVQRYAQAFEAHLRQTLHAQGFVEGRSSARFAQSLDLLVGKKQRYVPQPRFHYFPGLPEVQFYDPAQFAWLREVEAQTEAIRGELLEVLKEEGAFTPYVEAQAHRAGRDGYGLLGNPDWSAFYLWKSGTLVEENAARCPLTIKALEGAPLAHVPGRTPSVLFSLLRPGARIPPHTGYVNARLICHLPLIVPPRCAIRVGNEVREWREGEALVFDDTYEHEAWNESDQLRVVLLFDVWRPELTEEERSLVSAMVQAVDAYGGGAGDWG